jgi:hypothetical protein
VNFFDKTSAARMLQGLINTINQHAIFEAAAVHMSIQNINLNVFFNCKTEDVSQLLETPVMPDMMEVAVS